MIKLGEYNNLRVVKEVDFGIYLDGHEMGEILMPKQYVPEETRPGNELDVFLYCDSEDRIIATTLKPKATVGQFACLQVNDVNKTGAFLDWGLPKDLFVAFAEQEREMKIGKTYVVYLYLSDNNTRIAASSKLEKYLQPSPVNYKPGEKVELMLVRQTDLGYQALINASHWGMVFQNEIFTQVAEGQAITGYIKQVRDDGKIDLCLQKPGYDVPHNLLDNIINYLTKNGGSITITDKTNPQIIYRLFGVSKKKYKAALGTLYKQKIITLEKDKVTLIDNSDSGKNSKS